MVRAEVVDVGARLQLRKAGRLKEAHAVTSDFAGGAGSSVHPLAQHQWIEFGFFLVMALETADAVLLLLSPEGLAIVREQLILRQHRRVGNRPNSSNLGCNTQLARCNLFHHARKVFCAARLEGAIHSRI